MRGDDLATGEGLLHAGQVEKFRQRFPDAVGQMAQFVVDNPGQVALIASATVVITQAALNLMKPRTPAQALALIIVLNVGVPKLATAALEKGLITFRVRNADGKLVPLVIGKGEASAAPAET